MLKINFKGNEMTLKGFQLKVGDKAPNFVVVDNDLNKVELKDYENKVVVVTTFPSIDTSVCALQAKRFNEEAKKLKDIQIITISYDLPFALKRYCANEGIENAITTSDYMYRDFANKYGLLIDELQLLSRTVYVIGKDGVIKYYEICDEVTNEPNYDKVLEVVKSL